MLETTLATTFTPGSNVKGGVAAANWSFLLPSLELERVVCLGSPTPATLAALSRRAGRVEVMDGSGVASLPSESCDLAVISGRRGRSLFRLRRAELRRALKPEGSIYAECEAGRLLEELGSAQTLWLAPAAGEVQTAIPADDERTIEYFVRRGISSTSSQQRALERAERLASGSKLLRRLTRRRATLAALGGKGPPGAPPAYLRSLAQAEGVDIDSCRWGLSARGRYTSRKVVFFLFDERSGRPEQIVKITRDPGFNPRLENEYRALSLLEESRIADGTVLPQPTFFGRHAGLAVLGETMIEGEPFRPRRDPSGARPALELLGELGAATARPVAAGEVGGALGTLFARFNEIYRLTPEQHGFLADQIDAIAASSEPFPLVFQHGDPGTWNALVTASGKAAFLDWEAAEPEGVPLWDLFYFLRSYGVGVARAAGAKSSLEGFGRQFLADTELSRLLADETARYCARVGLSAALVEPLFHLCWMHRALKEATRRPPDRLEGGHYVGLLRLCIGRRSAPGLRRLFSSS